MWNKHLFKIERHLCVPWRHMVMKNKINTLCNAVSVHINMNSKIWSDCQLLWEFSCIYAVFVQYSKSFWDLKHTPLYISNINNKSNNTIMILTGDALTHYKHMITWNPKRGGGVSIYMVNIGDLLVPLPILNFKSNPNHCFCQPCSWKKQISACVWTTVRWSKQAIQDAYPLPKFDQDCTSS